METYKKVMNKLATVEKAIMAVSTVLILVLIFMNVIGRFIFNHSFAFVDEFVVAVFVLVSLIGAALAGRKDGGLIGLSFFSDGLKGKKRIFQKMLANFVSIIYCVSLTYQGYLRVVNDFSQDVHTFVLHWPQWVFSVFVPISGICLVLHLIENTFDFIKKIKNPVNQDIETSEAK